MIALPPRVRLANQAPVRPERDFVLYWSIAARRTRSNHALDRALLWCRELNKGLVVLDPLRIAYPWASVRTHTFIQQGMADVHARYESVGIPHHAYVEPSVDHGKGLLRALAAHACVVITDDPPAFHYPHMLAAAADQLDVRLEAVDCSGVVPLSAPDRLYKRAFDFRRALPKLIDASEPSADPLAESKLPRAQIPADILARWPAAEVDPRALGLDPLAPVPFRGGERAALHALNSFVQRIEDYADHRDHPDDDGASGLSPWLHHGHLSPYTVVDAVRRAAPGPEGPFSVSPSANKFLDELITWRELSHHTAARLPGFDRYDTVPDWARKSLESHESDPRERLYSLEELASASTSDTVWNAAQNQLLREGRIHNRVRMLWGKRVITWTRSGREAFDLLVELNNRYAIDGRDPCSWSGIAWCFGRYDRPWPNQPIFGAVRAMSSQAMPRKVRMRRYLQRGT